MKLFAKKIITGCEGRGDAESPYLTRYTLIEAFGCAIYLHIFHRSDADVFHDHPWTFITVPLWRGYTEYTPHGIYSVRPFRIYRRDAGWLHRVELRKKCAKNNSLREMPAVTLVFRGRICRTWGFWLGDRWEDFRTYFKRNGC